MEDGGLPAAGAGEDHAVDDCRREWRRHIARHPAGLERRHAVLVDHLPRDDGTVSDGRLQQPARVVRVRPARERVGCRRRGVEKHRRPDEGRAALVEQPDPAIPARRGDQQVAPMIENDWRGDEGRPSGAIRPPRLQGAGLERDQLSVARRHIDRSVRAEGGTDGARNPTRGAPRRCGGPSGCGRRRRRNTREKGSR